MTIKDVQKYAQEKECSLLVALDDCWCRLDEDVKEAVGREAVYILAFSGKENLENEFVETLYEYHEEIFEEEEEENEDC